MESSAQRRLSCSSLFSPNAPLTVNKEKTCMACSSSSPPLIIPFFFLLSCLLLSLFSSFLGSCRHVSSVSLAQGWCLLVISFGSFSPQLYVRYVSFMYSVTGFWELPNIGSILLPPWRKHCTQIMHTRRHARITKRFAGTISSRGTFLNSVKTLKGPFTLEIYSHVGIHIATRERNTPNTSARKFSQCEEAFTRTCLVTGHLLSAAYKALKCTESSRDFEPFQAYRRCFFVLQMKITCSRCW